MIGSNILTGLVWIIRRSISRSGPSRAGKCQEATVTFISDITVGHSGLSTGHWTEHQHQESWTGPPPSVASDIYDGAGGGVIVE